ncbi:nitric oxide dioxygenase [Curtobacterium sp. PhB136]|nr:nitric oxide dioxygenase [Curtobacterium sp. PhB136]
MSLLSDAAQPIVAATATALAARMPEISVAFYQRLFDAHPELLDGMFSRANQATGRQASALASSIVTFAVLMLDGDHPIDLVRRIAHRHASLGVSPQQYAVVYEHLFAAIAADLGDAATDAVVAAWTEVYWLFADLLVAEESRLHNSQPNPAFWAEWRVADSTLASSTVRSMTFTPTDDTPIADALPGQYVSVRVPAADGLRQVRQYSLLSPGQVRRIAVKRDDGGEVSPVLHGLQPGAIVEISNPYGELTLDESDRPLVLATAGIGCTPALGFLEGLTAAGSDRRVMVLHADRSHDQWALRSEVANNVQQLKNGTLHTWLDGRRMRLEDVQLPENPVVVMCGPLGFMKSLRDQAVAAGIADEDVRYEMFGPDVWLKSV